MPTRARSIRRSAARQERELAARLGGRMVKGSGCGHDKGDVRAGRVLVECKPTSRKSFAVTRELIEKLEREALATGRVPALQVEFLDGDRPSHRVLVVPDWVLDEPEGDTRGGAEGSTCPKGVT